VGVSDDDASSGMIAVLAGGLSLCCGLPLLFGASIAIGTAGVVVGSVLLVAAAAVLGTWGWRRRRRTTNCELDHPTTWEDTDEPVDQ
jgi:hypothetical protein